MLYDVNLGIRDYFTYTDAMLNNSLFSNYLKNHGLNVYKEESTRDLICLDFDYGSKDYDTEKKRIEKMLKDANEEDKDKYRYLLDKVEKNKDKYKKKSKDEIREEFYVNGVDVKYDSFNKDGTLKTSETIHYKMLFRTSAKAKLGQVIFINEKLYDIAYDWLTIGLGKKMPLKNAKIVEMSAYAPLTTSTIVGEVHIPVDEILILEDQDSLFKTMTNVVSAIGTGHYKKFGNQEIESKMCIVTQKESEVKNTLWDGMGLIESDVLPDWVNGMALLRNHMFKMCGIRTYIQKFLKEWCEENDKDYNTFTINDCFGIPHKAKDIKIITTDNAIKFKKFKDIMGGNMTDAYLYWCDRIKADGNIWGIVKTDHPSKLGVNQQMSYQMVNTLPCTKNDVRDLADTSITYVESLKTDKDEFAKFLIKNKNEINHYELMADMYNHNKKFADSKWFRYEKNKIISNYVNKLRNGKITVNADNLTVFGNPYGLLLYSVGEDWNKDSCFNIEEGTIQCYTSRFDDGEYLCGIRNPQNSPENIMYLHNVYNEIFDKYFRFSSNIMAVNCIGTDIQPRANGMDFDSDFAFVTNNSVAVRSAKIAYRDFYTVVNDLKESGITYDNTLSQYALMDSNFSKSKLGIGWSSNLAQLALTYYWDEIQREHPDPQLLKDLHDNIIILAVLA